jgi:hypothetical protein
VEKYLYKNFSKKPDEKIQEILILILFRKFLKCIFDVREFFATDEIAYKSLAKFGNYLQEIQTLFAVKNLLFVLIDFKRFCFP